ncbi:MAG TPA: iron ABC transporter permease [Methanospirillum sp.]|uniref:FecCD family ABC transporter permease n=1 Tax=Methanospirillum sp. TaxID=45200 RepID=UPI002CC05928|nr:iron ABC transporter permease [Methanospirillum sp.]HWQ64176.1 iron ABC transporter permease [Methanospirillum sp.]
MHLKDGSHPTAYIQYTRSKIRAILLGCLLLFFIIIISISVGPVFIPPDEVLKTLMGISVTEKWDTIIWDIRLPEVIAGIIAGVGLAIAGVAMQSILRNPLGEPYTLGISSAAAFGAAFSVMFLSSGKVGDGITILNPYLTTVVAFAFSLLATVMILVLSRYRAASPEVMVLAGVAIGSLFVAARMFLEYFASDIELASIIFWTFGDLSRAGWDEIWLMSIVIFIIAMYFYHHRWSFNAIDAGDETAQSLGVDVKRVRLVGMVAASFLAAIITSFLGVIGFVGLVAPHMVRRIIGDDNRYLIPGSCVAGAIMLLGSDTVARVIMAPTVIPVSILTAFLGVPLFLYLLLKGWTR